MPKKRKVQLVKPKSTPLGPKVPPLVIKRKDIFCNNEPGSLSYYVKDESEQGIKNTEVQVADGLVGLKIEWSSIRDDQKPKSSTQLLKHKPGFAGSVQNIFYCDLCNTAFITEEFVIDHIRKYHKILKRDWKPYVSDHCV